MRHELKYILTPVQYRILRDRLKWVLKPDPHAGENGEYVIRSIYFDTEDKDALWEKQSGVDRRKKYRIRFYNRNADKCTLECKEKQGTRIRKISEPLDRRTAEQLLSQEEVMAGMLDAKLALWMKKSGFRPVVTIDYVREPYVFPVSNVRITFDKELAAGGVKDSLTMPRYFPNIMGDQIILEVKYDQFLPKHISELIASVHPTLTAASKYVMCMEHRLGEMGFGRQD